MLLLACARPNQATSDSGDASAVAGDRSLAAPPSATVGWRVTEMGWGPIRAGMTVAEARVALGGQLPEPINRECDHIRPPDGPQGVLVMTVNGQVARVEVRDTTVVTAAGARVGDTEARINALYPGRVRTTPHKYVDGHYLIVPRGPGADSIYRLVFETDGRLVTRLRGGRLPQVEWVEGCG
jgi:hypothetical protein